MSSITEPQRAILLDVADVLIPETDTMPSLRAADREKLLAFVERALAASRFDPASVEDLFDGAPSERST